ncbi:hypothetical protein CASFOL_030017 [Castilleja foliolosa]|uniref:F-box domain-containing protein n=1 Tax=Castilleja foliolosa TaxID=1961234 RepID=A0ABD3C9J3_9LAMI
MDGLTESKVNIVPTTKETDEEEEEEEKGNSEIVPTINSLPDELVFEILLHLPAQDIYNAVMNVSRKWNQIIHTHTFVNTHLHRSTYGLLVQNRVSQPTQLSFIALSRQGRVELTRLNYKPNFKIWCNSCNGLILEWEREKTNLSGLYITNPATMQHFTLPPFFEPMCFIFSALAYASLSMVYKVVIVFSKEKECSCAILTVGVDESWRPVRTQHLSLESKKRLFSRTPLTTQGFVHWASGGDFVLTLNVETEIITEYVVPSFVPSLSSRDTILSYHYYSAVKYLSLLIRRGGWCWEIWEMKPETGEWTKLSGIKGKDLKDRRGEIVNWSFEHDKEFNLSSSRMAALVPVGWLKYKEVLVFHVVRPGMNLAPRFCMAWNVQSKETQFIELDSGENVFLAHMNSLVWLDGC